MNHLVDIQNLTGFFVHRIKKETERKEEFLRRPTLGPSFDASNHPLFSSNQNSTNSTPDAIRRAASDSLPPIPVTNVVGQDLFAADGNPTSVGVGGRRSSREFHKMSGKKFFFLKCLLLFCQPQPDPKQFFKQSNEHERLLWQTAGNLYEIVFQTKSRNEGSIHPFLAVRRE